MNMTQSVAEKRGLFPLFPGKFFAILLVVATFLFSQDVLAAPAYRASGTFTSGTVAITPPYPASMAANDVCLLAVESENQAIALTTANGFVQVPTWSPQSAGTAATNPATRLALFWKRTVGGDTAPVVTDPGDHATAQIHCFSGVVTSGNPWDTGAGNNDGAVNDTSGTIPGSTTTVMDTLVVLVISTSFNNTSTTECSAWTNVDLTSLTERTDNTNTAGLGGGHCLATGVKASAGAYTTTTVTLANTSFKGAISLALKPVPTTTLSTGTDPANSSIAPSATATAADAFTLQTNIGTDVVSAVVVGLGAGISAGLSLVEITDDAGTTVYGSVANPASDTPTITLSTNTLTATTTATQYRIRVTPKSHANMPVPPGTTYSVTAKINSWTSTYAQTGTDTAGTTVTIDNLSPAGATAVSGSAGTTDVTLNWTTSASADFSRSVVLRWTGASAGAQVPAEGTDYVNGNTIGTATVVCVRTTDAASTAVTELDGAAGNCNVTPLTVGQAYTYKVFQKDSNGNYDVGVALGTFTPVPKVVSINRVDLNPISSGTSVSWTVVFSLSMTGVDSGDFALVQAGGVSGASITSVTGSGTTWTVTTTTGTGTGTLGLNLVDNDSIVDGSSNRLGGTGAGNGNFTGEVYTVTPPCVAPSNVPVGVTVTCVCDVFGRASLNPSTIYGANWIVSRSDTIVPAVVPYIASTGYLRLTENNSDNAKAATVPGIFPAAGNYISVEFQHYAYGGSGADGIAVTLSDYAVTAVPGAYGGSLGYAQKTGAACATPPCNGFAGGWIGIGIDEFGNYQNPTEGRIGGPGVRVDSVGVRGSGSGVAGYNWMAGTAANLVPQIDNTGSATPAPGYYYQVIVDARNDPTSTSVTVNRNTGAGYAALINIPNVYTAATAQGFTQGAVPNNWQISFTGSTGGQFNYHEIGGLRICAQTIAPPSGGTASGFNAIDEAYGTPPATPVVQSFLNGHIYMKVTGLPFKFNVAALNNNQILTTYAAGSNKNVTIKLVDNSDAGCIIDSTQPNYCSSTLPVASPCTARAAVTGGSQTIIFAAADSGKKQSANFTLNTAYKNLVAIISDGTTTACSTDAFSVRPASIASVTSSNATYVGVSAAPIFKAGTDPFSLTATTTGIAGSPSGYTGVLKINSTAIQPVQPVSPITLTPPSFAAAVSATPSSTATGSTFTYSEVGAFYFLGYNPGTDATSARGVYDGVSTASECAAPVTPAQCDTLRAATWMGVDSITSKGDCVQSNYSNTKDASGKYGCSFGIIANTVMFGRFIPDHFDVTSTYGCTAGSFTYSGQPFLVTAMAFNGAGLITKNYDSGGGSGFAKDVTILSPGNPNYFNGNVIAGANNFSNGSGSTYPVINPLTGPNPPITYTFPVKETPPLTPSTLPTPPTTALRATDGDGVSSLNHIEPQIHIRSGRLHMFNAYGSELLTLSIPMRVEYYSAADGWLTHTADTCTSLNFSNLDLQNAVHNPNQGIATINIKIGPNIPSTVTVISPTAGVGELSFSAPGTGGDGYADARMDLSASTWLQFDWNGAGITDPTARATFGLYRGNPRSIYLRERY